MSLQFCQLIIAGHLSRAPEFKKVKDRGVCTFAVAINRRWKGADGATAEAVTFVECQAWGKAADFVAAYFGKGEPIHIVGRLEQENWIDKTTKAKRSRLRCIVIQASFVESKGHTPAAVSDENGGA